MKNSLKYRLKFNIELKVVDVKKEIVLKSIKEEAKTYREAVEYFKQNKSEKSLKALGDYLDTYYVHTGQERSYVLKENENQSLELVLSAEMI